MSSQLQKGEISLKQVLVNFRNFTRYLLSKWKLVAVMSTFGCLMGLIVSLLSIPVYTASTSFILESSKKSSSGYAGIAEKLGLSIAMGGGGGGDIFRDDDNLITFMKSRTIIAQTLYTRMPLSDKNELLIERYLKLNDFPEEWRSDARLANLQFHAIPEERTVLEDSVINVLYKILLDGTLNVSKPDKEKDLIIASTSSVDEAFSKAFNENLLEKTRDFYTNIQTKKAKDNIGILQYQVDSVRTLLNAALSGVASSTDANPNLNPAFQRVKVSSQKKLIDVEMNKAILIELVKNLEMARMTLRQETPLVQVIDRPVLPLKKRELRKFKGIVLGGALLGFFTAVFLAIRYYIRKVLSEAS